jgi:galactitol-specific phosphotransferase system IIB component
MDDNTNNDSKLIDQAKQFDEKINTIKTQFFSALDDFKKYYVYFNKNPEVNEFQNYYANSKGQLQSMSRDLFITTNNIDKNIEILNDEMSGILPKLKKEKRLNEKLLKQLQNLKNTQNGSEILVDDSKTAYNIQYYKNWEMFIGVVIVTGLIFKIYKAPIAPTNK